MQRVLRFGASPACASSGPASRLVKRAAFHEVGSTHEPVTQKTAPHGRNEAVWLSHRLRSRPVGAMVRPSQVKTTRKRLVGENLQTCSHESCLPNRPVSATGTGLRRHGREREAARPSRCWARGARENQKARSQRPDLPPSFLSRRTSMISMPRSTALHMS